MEEIQSVEREKKLRQTTLWLNGLMAFCTLFSVASIVFALGWRLDESQVALLRNLSYAGVGIFFAEEIARIFYLHGSFLKYMRTCLAEMLLTFAIPVAFILGGEYRSDPDSLKSFVCLLHLLVILVAGVRALRFRGKIDAVKRLSPGRIFIFSFAALILCGTLMLLTPRASVSGISFTDALFFATSAVCVTGLVPVASLPETLTEFGQYILLVLAQLGGLGVMSITYFFAYFFAGGLSIRNRFAFQDLFSEDNLTQIGIILGVLVGFTFSVEAIGACWIYFSYAAGNVADPIFFSVFHAVMAFCNAGFSTLPDGLATSGVPEQTGFLFAIIALAIIGGIGFPVFKNFWLVSLSYLRRHLFRRHGFIPARLSTHSKIVLASSGLILVAGTVLLLLSAIGTGEMDFMRALFLSAATRTAGFDIGNAALLPTGALLTMMVLMFIGGAPFSTAGGIKVTTFAVAVLAIRQFLSGKRDLEIFGRRLNGDIAHQALALVLLTGLFFAAVAIVLCTLHPEIAGEFLMFEAISAVATVGVSCNVTPLLCDGAKFVLIAAMFVGRIGILLFLASFIQRRENTGARLPEDSIVLS